jgi:hypothetical protein
MYVFIFEKTPLIVSMARVTHDISIPMEGIMKQSEIPRLYTPRQAADLLGVKSSTLAEWRSTGRYDLCYVKVGRRIMYPENGLVAFIEKRTRYSTSA